MRKFFLFFLFCVAGGLSAKDASPPLPPTFYAAPIDTPHFLDDRPVVFSWNANTETDLAGYKIYWDDDASSVPYAHSLVVGNVLTKRVTLAEYAEKCYKNLKGAEYAAQFMIITFECTDFMREKSPATVHVDGTARPQIISAKANPSYHKILTEYHRLTGIPTLVNTSFNMHEEPIVCTPGDAVRSFMQGHLDYLAIGNFIAKNQEGVNGRLESEELRETPFRELN